MALCGAIEAMTAASPSAMSSFLAAGGLDAALDNLSQTTDPLVQVELVRVLRCVSNVTGDLAGLAAKAHYDVVGMLRHVASSVLVGSVAKKEISHLLTSIDEPNSRSPLPPIS